MVRMRGSRLGEVPERLQIIKIAIFERRVVVVRVILLIVFHH